MSRGGRGGGGLNTGSRMRGQPLPFNVDPEIEEEVERNIAADSSDDKEMFPEIGLLPPRPPTDEERELVRLFRIRRAKMKASPFWTGDLGDYASKMGDPSMPGGFNPFEEAPTFSNNKRRRDVVTPSLKGVKNIYPQFFPKEFHHLFKAAGEADGGDGRVQKKLALAKQSVRDRLAKFDDDADVPAKDDDEDDEAARVDDEGDEPFEQPVDDTYEEDDDDAGNDYNAEAYFDDGEADVEDYGGDEFGDDGY